MVFESHGKNVNLVKNKQRSTQSSRRGTFLNGFINARRRKIIGLAIRHPAELLYKIMIGVIEKKNIKMTLKFVLRAN